MDKGVFNFKETKYDVLWKKISKDYSFIFPI